MIKNELNLSKYASRYDTIPHEDMRILAQARFLV